MSNKKYLKPVFFLLTIIFVFSIRTPYAVRAMSKSSQHKLYQKTMKSYARKAKASYKKYSFDNSPSSRRVMYLFVDLDKNGTDELIMRYAEPSERNTAKGSGYGESTTIYTIKNGKVVTVLDHSSVNPMCHGDFVHIFRNRSRIDIATSHGYDNHTFCKYSKGILYRKKNVIRMTGGRGMYGYETYYNNKAVSLSSYRAKYKSLTNNEKGYIMKLYK